ncbi:GNAT family N-acetyltransferase [Ornithinibacillus sp. JPR2-1]|uniref:GNAT family N-acetyltransferase n=1 Tax=Ornithinibacillus sp. JPR2-1 TaxID=2094019 RepID=UPI0031D6E158
MNINIRDAYEDDIQDIIYLRRQLDDFHAEMRPDVFISSNLYDEEDIKSYLETKKSRVIIIENPTNEIIGYAVLNTERVEKNTIFNNRTFIYVNEISIREDLRGQGLGKLVLKWIVEYAKTMNVEAVELDVYECNEVAVNLYKSIGMKNRTNRMELKL